MTSPQSAAKSKSNAKTIRPAGGSKPFFYWLTQSFVKIFGVGYFRTRIVGAENFPRQGPCLVLANHSSFLDPAIIGSMIPREMHFLARESLFSVPLLGWHLRTNNTHPIRREGIDRGAIRMSVDILKSGWPLLVFPEGTRSPDGLVRPPKGGFGMILEQIPDVPCIPMLIRGTEKAMGRGAVIPRPVRLEIHIGSPFQIEPKGMEESRRDFYARCSRRLEEEWRKLGADIVSSPPTES